MFKPSLLLRAWLTRSLYLSRINGHLPALRYRVTVNTREEDRQSA